MSITRIEPRNDSSNHEIITFESNLNRNDRTNKIIDAIRNDSLNELQSLVDQGYSLDIEDDEGLGPIYFATKHGSLNILNWLIKEKHCSINSKVAHKNKFKYYSPLRAAIFFGHLEMVKWICAETDCEDACKSYLLLQTAIKADQIPIIEWLLDEKKISCTIEDKGKNLLWLAVHYGSLPVIKWLVQEKNFTLSFTKKSDNFFRDGYKHKNNFFYWVLCESSSFKCSDLKHLEIIQWLVEEQAFSLNEIDVIENIVFLVIETGHLDLLKWLVEEKGYSLNVKNNDGDNVLISAFYHKKLAIAKWLVEEKNFSLNVIDSTGCNPLLIACAKGHLETVKWLIEEKKLSLEVDDGFGRTAIIQAISEGRLKTAKYLVEEKNCSLDVRSTTHGNHPLHYAIYAEHLKLFIWLVNERHCSLEIKNNSNEAIILIAINRCEKIADWLIKDLNIFKEQYFRDALKAYDTDNGCQTYDLLKYFSYLISNCQNNEEINYWMQLVDKKISYASKNYLNFFIEKRNKAYNLTIKALKQANSPYREIVLKHYCAVNKHSLEHIDILLRDDNIKKTIKCLYSFINDDQTWSYTGYDLWLMSNNELKIKKKIEIEILGERLKYRVIGLDNQEKSGMILLKDLSEYFPKSSKEVLIQKNKFLFEILKHTSKAGHTLSLKEEAKINLAEILLHSGVNMKEENSPIDIEEAFLTADNYIMKRSIQAYYLLHDITCEPSQRIKNRLDYILSGNKTVAFFSKNSTRPTWSDKAIFYYELYLKSKEFNSLINMPKQT